MKDLLLQTDRKLSEVTTFGIGGTARYYVEVRDVETLRQTLAYCRAHSLRYFVLGKGSNCLFADRGYNGLVIANRIDFIQKPAEDTFYVGAGYSFSLLGTQTARQGWSGLEFASGIPGSVGGAVYMNAGANGRETCESLISVDCMKPDGTVQTLLRSEIEFRYRYSSFQDKTDVIVAATFKLTSSPSAREKQLEIIQYRKKTQPYGSKSAGCVFRNPSCGHAGALIDKCGLKGETVGGAEVSPVHANFVINKGNATANDILELIQKIKATVKIQTGEDLHSEIYYIPFEDP